MNDSQLQELLNAGQVLSNSLSMADRYMEAAVVTGLVQACRTLRTKLEPPAPPEAPPPTPEEK